MPKKLMIVESPAKARTLAKFLGGEYEVKASMGHVRDLPKSDLGVDVEHDFQPKYVVPKDKQKVVKELRSSAEKASDIYIATDPDREGEAIAWHIKEALKLDGGVRRITFHEITKEAIAHAVTEPRGIDTHLVDAQQARRVLDRLVGYELSPLLWAKIRRGLSAGRVQSVAVRLVCERDREIAAFVAREYWSIDADLSKLGDGPPPRDLRARLVEIGGKKCEKVDDPAALHDEAVAQAVVERLTGAQYQVADVRQKEVRRTPAPPFITSTLQQEAGRKLGFTAKRTMAVAQQLYEGLDVGEGSVGLITYMRTDSTQVAQSALAEARDFIRKRHGNEFRPEKPRFYRSRVKNAQEAHEAIRPTSVWREPSQMRGRLTPDQYRLYRLIWERFVASQMEAARLNQTTIDVVAADCLFRATGSVVIFAGFMVLYQEGLDDAEEDEGGLLPEVQAGEPLLLRQLVPAQHFTQPPPHYTEATLIKDLERFGVGRPSTYAPILQTIQDRDYVTRDKRLLKATDLGFLVNDLLVEHFPDVFQVGFTAQMEEKLDEIASGGQRWVPIIRDFYGPFKATLDLANQTIERFKGEPTDISCEKCGEPMVIKLGRYGKFLACTGYPECRNTRPIRAGGDGQEPDAPAPVELSDRLCEKCGKPMAIKMGRFGRFLSCTGFPECKHTQPFTIGVKCPKCGRELAERKFKGRDIWSCTGYPECKFTAWNRPLDYPCPQCGGFLTITPGKRIQCLDCSYRRGEGGEEEGEAEPEEPTARRPSRPRRGSSAASMTTKTTKSRTGRRKAG